MDRFQRDEWMSRGITPGLQQGPLPQSCLKSLRLPNIGPGRLVELVGIQGLFALPPLQFSPRVEARSLEELLLPILPSLCVDIAHVGLSSD